ncbi:jg10757 [Pararge aegeria aegeria]|uniref:Jg10757 protein n=1 Tax=Pararge aegeria aegeria TaxID=348720 RepID=A0A8S4RGJ5_9NEOP|nr:jg10757 [Pararge aegeria aegeria]
MDVESRVHGMAMRAYARDARRVKRNVKRRAELFTPPHHTQRAESGNTYTSYRGRRAQTTGGTVGGGDAGRRPGAECRPSRGVDPVEECG